MIGAMTRRPPGFPALSLFLPFSLSRQGNTSEAPGSRRRQDSGSWFLDTACSDIIEADVGSHPGNAGQDLSFRHWREARYAETRLFRKATKERKDAEEDELARF
jgi:hypothetical protein